jgi:DNA invertase Pin-like site-specific DNA recombinase
VIAYTRVSSVEQGESGAGLEAQRAAILQAHPNITAWYQDIASGSGKHLPGREAALEHAMREKLPLVAAKLDRLTRSAIDFHTINELSRKHGFPLILLDVGLDSSTPMGEAMAGMVAVFAQLERRRISERTKEALAVKKAQGVRLGRPRTIPQAVRNEASRLLAEGVTPQEISRVLPISRASVYALRS